jgi:hypothetical protein
MDEKKHFTDYYNSLQDGTGPTPIDVPDGGPRASKLHAGVSDLLAGKPAADQPPTPAGVDASVFEEARRAAQDPQDPSYAIASALLVVAQELADLKGSQP